MQITEVSILTRANTSIDWPETGVPFSDNNPFKTGLNVDYTQTTTISNDGLVKTNSKIWNNQAAFVASRVYNGSETEQWFNNLISNGFTYHKTIEVSL